MQKLTLAGPYVVRANMDGIGKSSSTTPSKQDRLYSLDPSRWALVIRIICLLFRFIFVVMECFTRAKEGIFGSEKQNKLEIRSIGERTVLTRQNSLHRKSSIELLMSSWFERSAISGHEKCSYVSRKDAMESVIVSSSFSAHGKRMASLVLRDKDKRNTISKAKAALRSIQVGARKSVKFRFLFKNLMAFLEDVEKSRVSSVAEFVDTLAREMLSRTDQWYLEFIHNQVRAGSSPKSVYETTLGILSLFFREGAGLESFIISGAWKNSDRAVNATLTLIMYCAVSRCVPQDSNEINVTEFSGVERVLLASAEQKFIRYVSRSSTKSMEVFKDKLMWDITLNCCNEFVESTWSDDCLERVVWTLQYGIKHINVETYRKMKELNGKRKLDLTHMNPLCLITFSVSGMVRFSGVDDCIYKITQDPGAKIALHGTLPMPTIQDLVLLDLIGPVKGSTYAVKRVPGSDLAFQALAIGDRLRLAPSQRAGSFSARLDQCVG